MTGDSSGHGGLPRGARHSDVPPDAGHVNPPEDPALADLHQAGVADARLYLAAEENGVGGAGAFFLLLDEPEVYGFPPDPVSTTRDLPKLWRAAAVAAGALVAGIAVAVAGGRR